MAGDARIFAQLLSFARDNEVGGILELLRMGCPPTFANGVGQTALHIGAMWGSTDAVKALLEAKAQPNQPNQLRGSTPLHAAAMGKGPAEKRAACAKLMIEYKGDPRKADLNMDTPIDCAEDERVRTALGGVPLILHNAVQARQVNDLQDALRSILQGACGNLSVDTQNAKGETALWQAVRSGWLEGLDLLIEVRAHPSIPDIAQRTPLHVAVLGGQQIMLQKLLSAKADARATDRDPDHDPRFSSTTFEETPDKHRTALHYAAELGNVLAISALLEARADVNAKDSKSQTPLHLCLDLRADSEPGQGSGVRVVGLEKRPDWNRKLGTIIDASAAMDGDASNMRYPVLLQGSQQGVLLKPANIEQLPEATLDALLAAGADVNAGSHVIGESRTVLHVAARLGDDTLVNKVLVARANVNQVDSKLGMSALHLAARGKYLKVVKLLLDAEAELGQKASNGKTAAELAKANGAGAEMLALLNGDAPPTASEMIPAATYESLTQEQRAALFID